MGYTHTLDFEKTVIFFFRIPGKKKNNEKILGENNFIKNLGVVEFWHVRKFAH